MNTTRMYLDVPGEGYGHASYPSFSEDGVEVLSTPRSHMVLTVHLAAPAKLESFFDGALVNTRSLEAGDQKLPLSELVPLKQGKASFTVTADGAEPVQSTVYSFVDDYFTPYQAYTQRRYKEGQRREERNRLAQACPPPVAPATYKDMIAAQLEKANDAARQAEIKMLSGADLSKKAAAEGTTDADIEGALASAVRAGQDAVRLLESVKLYRQYAAYYREVEETHKS